MLLSRGFAVFFLFSFSFFFILVSQSVCSEFSSILHREVYMRCLHANRRHPAYQVTPAITMASIAVTRIKTFQLQTMSFYLFFFFWEQVVEDLLRISQFSH